MRFLVALALALTLSVGGGLVLGEAESAVTHFLKGSTTCRPQDRPCVYTGPAKSLARQPSQGRPALSHPRGRTGRSTAGARPYAVRVRGVGGAARLPRSRG